MPTIINLPKPAPTPTYKVGQSVWFENDINNPGADVRSGVITALLLDDAPPKITIKSRNPAGKTVDEMNLVLSGPGSDIIYNEPPGKKGEPGIPEPAPVQSAAPVEPTPAPSTLPIPALGSFIRYRDSTGICQGEVKDDAGDNQIWVLKPGNTKRTKVAISAIVAHVTDAPAPAPAAKAPEVVTPTVEAPAKPAPAAQTPAVRQAAPVATAQEAISFPNLMGAAILDPKFLDIPIFYVASSGKVYEAMGALKGDIRLGYGMGDDATDHVILSAMQEPRKVKAISLAPVELAIIWVDSYWVEKIDYEEKLAKSLIPVVAKTPEALAAAQRTSKWPFVVEARALVLVKQPKGVTSPMFKYEIGGEMFALARWKIGGAATTSVFKPLMTRCSRLGGNKPPECWRWEMKIMLEDGKNIWAKPLMRGMGEWPAEMVEQFRSFIPKQAVDVAAVSEDDDHHPAD